VRRSEKLACRCTRFVDGKPLAPTPEVFMERRCPLRVRRRGLRACRGEWPRGADPLLAPRRANLAAGSRKLASRHAKSDPDTSSVAEPEPRAETVRRPIPTRRRMRRRTPRLERSTRIKWDGRTSGRPRGSDVRDFGYLRRGRPGSMPAGRPAVPPSHLIRVDPPTCGGARALGKKHGAGRLPSLPEALAANLLRTRELY